MEKSPHCVSKPSWQAMEVCKEIYRTPNECCHFTKNLRTKLCKKSEQRNYEYKKRSITATRICENKTKGA